MEGNFRGEPPCQGLVAMHESQATSRINQASVIFRPARSNSNDQPLHHSEGLTAPSIAENTFLAGPRGRRPPIFTPDGECLPSTWDRVSPLRR